MAGNKSRSTAESVQSSGPGSAWIGTGLDTPVPAHRPVYDMIFHQQRQLVLWPIFVAVRAGRLLRCESRAVTQLSRAGTYFAHIGTTTGRNGILVGWVRTGSRCKPVAFVIQRDLRDGPCSLLQASGSLPWVSVVSRPSRVCTTGCPENAVTRQSHSRVR